MEGRIMTLEETIEHNRRLAESYHRAYVKQTVEDGATYDDWKFAPHATYFSPYFGNNMIDLDNNPMTVQQSATMEASTYCVTLPDWTILSFESWPSDRGFVMKSHFGGHDKDGVMHDFYAYGFVDTNEKGEITHWETHVSPEYNEFLDVVLGVHGPFKNGAHEYMMAVAKKMKEAGVQIHLQGVPSGAGAGAAVGEETTGTGSAAQLMGAGLESLLQGADDPNVEIINDYNNTDELLKEFPVIHPTTVTTQMEKDIQNRLLTGFANWNRGTAAWVKWGSILYTPESLYNVHGVHLTLKEYQTTSALSFKVSQMQMGNFNNMLVCGDWCAIFYDILSTDRRTGTKKPGTVMEFVNFKNYGKDLGTRVVEGWAGTVGADYSGLMHFLSDAERANQNAFMDKIANMTLPETDDLAKKYPVAHVTPDHSDLAGDIRTAILTEFDAYNKGAGEWTAAADAFFAPELVYHTDDRNYTLSELKASVAEQDAKQKTTRLYFENMLISGEWAAIHFRKNMTDRTSGTRTAGNEMKFLHFEKKEDGLKVIESWNK